MTPPSEQNSGAEHYRKLAARYDVPIVLDPHERVDSTGFTAVRTALLRANDTMRAALGKS